MMDRIASGILVISAVGLVAVCSAGAGGLMELCQATDAPKAASAPEKKIKLQTTCPVMGGAIDRNTYVDSDGKRIYMCCKGCSAALKKEPAKYIKKLEDEGITVAKLQTTCPVKGGAINKSLYVDHDGKRIYVCCNECIAEVQKDPAKYVKSMEEAGVALDPVGKVKEEGQPAKM